MCICRGHLCAFLTLGCLVVAPSPVLALRVILIDVELDETPILQGSWGDDGAARPYTVWRYLKLAAVRPVRDRVIQPEPGQPLEAVLRGKLMVKVRYGYGGQCHGTQTHPQESRRQRVVFRPRLGRSQGTSRRPRRRGRSHGENSNCVPGRA
jgi:hypothetical protein